MSYYKFSTISGRRADGTNDSVAPNGHWSPAAAAGLARRMRFEGSVELAHHIGDMSGHGRGGETRFRLDLDTGACTRLGYKDVDDSALVHELHDAAEA